MRKHHKKTTVPDQYKITIHSTCTQCGECIDICPRNVLSLIQGKVTAQHSERCIGCYICETTCSVHAVRVRKK